MAKAYIHFHATRRDGTRDSFQTIGVPCRRREDGALLVLWGRWRLVRNGQVIIACKFTMIVNCELCVAMYAGTTSRGMLR